MRVRWLRGALRNLDQAVAYITRANPGAAERVARRIRDAASSLGHHPYIGRESVRLEGTRELALVGYPYIIRYRIKNETVEILRIHHTSQRWPEERD